MRDETGGYAAAQAPPAAAPKPDTPEVVALIENGLMAACTEVNIARRK